MNYSFIFIAVFTALFVFMALLLIRRTKTTEQPAEGATVKIYGHVQFAEGIDDGEISKVELYGDRILINSVAIIPFERIQQAEYSKLVKVGKGGYGSTVQRYFGELKIQFTDKNGQKSCIRCETPKKNQFHLIYQYEHMKKQINKRLGIEDQQTTAPLQNPYEL